MEKQTLIAISMVLVFLGHTVRGAAPSLEKRVETLEALVQGMKANNEGDEAIRRYPVDDQHDTLAVTMQEAQTDARLNKIQQTARQVQWDELQEPYSHGAIPEATMLSVQLQMKIDDLSEQALQFKTEALRTKVLSLEGLRTKNLLQFYQNDAATNEAQLHWWEFEQKKAQATADYSADVYSRRHDLFLSGAGTWGDDHQAALDAKTSTEAVNGWKHKCEEQSRQRDASDQALEEYQRQHPNRGGK